MSQVYGRSILFSRYSCMETQRFITTCIGALDLTISLLFSLLYSLNSVENFRVAMILALAFLVLLYLYNVRNFRYWRDRGVKHDTPIPFFGNNFRQFAQWISTADIAAALYRKYPKERYVGFYMANDLILLLRDPELIKHVLADSANFGRGLNLNPDADPEPMYRNIIFGDGDLWKLLRQRMAPAFTTTKLKGMFPNIAEKARILQTIVGKTSQEGKEIDTLELMMRYATDISGTYYFGHNVDSLNQEDCPYRKLGKRIFLVTKREVVVGLLKHWFPTLCAGLEMFNPELKRTFLSIFKRAASERNYEPSDRNDFIDVLLEMKRNGPMTGDSIETLREDGTPQTVEIEFDDLLMSAQMLQLFAAGVESTASVASFTLHQLAYHPEVQLKCQEEVDRVLEKHNHQLTFEAVNEMTYLEMAFKESLRMFPATAIILRLANRRYTLPGTNLTIDGGVKVAISLEGMQNDEKHFEDSDEFRPERFHPDKCGEIMRRKVYLPFGDGHRHCFGDRLAATQSTAALATILRDCDLRPGRATVRRPPRDPTTTMVQGFTHGLPLLLVPRKK